jgi:hypothetical protein
MDEDAPSNTNDIRDPESDNDIDNFSDSESELDDFEGETGDFWEPQPEQLQGHQVEQLPLTEELDNNLPATSADHSMAHNALQNPPYVELFNDIILNANAGASIRKDWDANSSYQDDLFNNTTPWAPFTSQIDWEVARWAKLCGPSSTAFSDLLKIEGVRLH